MGQSWLSKPGTTRNRPVKDKDIKDHPFLSAKDGSSLQFSDLHSDLVSSTLTHIGGASHPAMLKLALTCGALQTLLSTSAGWRQAVATDFKMAAVDGGSGASAFRWYQFLCQFGCLRGKYVINKGATRDAGGGSNLQLEFLEIEFTDRGFSAARWCTRSGSGPVAKEAPFLEGRLVPDPTQGGLVKIVPSCKLPRPQSSWPVTDLYTVITSPTSLRQCCDLLRLLTEVTRLVAILGLVYTLAILAIALLCFVIIYSQMPRFLHLLRCTRHWQLHSWMKETITLEELLAFDIDVPSLISEMVAKGFLVPLGGATSLDPRFLGDGGAWPESLPKAGIYEGNDDRFQVVVKYSSDRMHVSALFRQEKHSLVKENLSVPVTSAMTMSLREQSDLSYDDYMALDKGLRGNPRHLTCHCPLLLPLGNTTGVTYCRAWYTPSPPLPRDHPFRWKLLVVSEDKFVVLLNSNTKIFKRRVDIW